MKLNPIDKAILAKRAYTEHPTDAGKAEAFLIVAGAARGPQLTSLMGLWYKHRAWNALPLGETK